MAFFSCFATAYAGLQMLAGSLILRKVATDILNKAFGWGMAKRLEAG